MEGKKMTATETLAAKLNQTIAASIPEVTEAEMLERMSATDRALKALRTFMGPAQMDVVEYHSRSEALSEIIFEKLGETYTAEIAENAACASQLGEFARAGISEEDYATLTGRWFAAFEGE